MNKTSIINLIVFALLTLSTGLFTGYSLGHSEAQTLSFGEIKPVSDLNLGIATFKLLKEENGQLHGQVDGQKARIAYHPEHILDLKPGESFEIPLKDVNLSSYYEFENIPEGMAYISSKSGKYYYSILDPRALRLNPKTRLYFTTEIEAQEAGFIAPK